MKKLESIHSKSLAILVLLTALGLATAPAALAGGACAGVEAAPVGSTVRGFAAETMSWRVELAGPGILSLEASGPEGLELTARPCGGAGDPIVLEEAATRLVFAVLEAGDWRVEARGPQVMPRVKLTADFLADDAVASETLAAPFGTKEDEHEVDPDPAPVPPPPGSSGGLCWRPASKESLFGTKEDEHEVDPDPAPVPPPPGSTGGLCWRPQPTDGLDDHADTFACASPIALGRPVTGELLNAWGDDEDVYRFTLGETRRVRLGVVGEAGVGVGLYDVFGQRLEEAAGGSRLVRTLLPGTYFVRVSGEREGIYEVVAE